MKEKIILAAVYLDGNDDFKEGIKECEALCHANDMEVVRVITQNSRSIDRNTVFRKGKLEELKEAVQEEGVKTIVFYNNLNLTLSSRIGEYCEAEVLDRTSLILDIFASRARTKEAMIQTEMAKIRYLLPSYQKENGGSDKMRGGSVNNRGAGESKTALVKRKMEARLAELKKELEKMEAERREKANRRKKSNLKKVALVGYTNAGKSSFMNALLLKNENEEKEVFAKDMLFATLDTSIRRVYHKGYAFLLYDTVGFVSDLPHDLIEAFHSTLAAAKEADLLLNVMDVSNTAFERQKEVTLKTLRKIGASDIPVMDVHNKIDCLEERGIHTHEISLKTKEGFEELLDHIVDTLYPKEEVLECLIPYHKMHLLDDYSLICEIKILDQQEDGVKIKIAGSKETLLPFHEYCKD